MKKLQGRIIHRANTVSLSSFVPRPCLWPGEIFITINIKKFALIQSFFSLIFDPFVRHSMVKSAEEKIETRRTSNASRKHQLARAQFETTSSVTSYHAFWTSMKGNLAGFWGWRPRKRIPFVVSKSTENGVWYYYVCIFVAHHRKFTKN